MATKTYAVTGILANGDDTFTPVPGLVLTRTEVRAAILGGPRLTDGVHVPGGWHALVCDTCHDTHEHCPDLMKALA